MRVNLKQIEVNMSFGEFKIRISCEIHVHITILIESFNVFINHGLFLII